MSTFLLDVSDYFYCHDYQLSFKNTSGLMRTRTISPSFEWITLILKSKEEIKSYILELPVFQLLKSIFSIFLVIREKLYENIKFYDFVQISSFECFLKKKKNKFTITHRIIYCVTGYRLGQV